MNFNLECPFNNLSFGAISHGITQELFKRGISPNIFAISNQVDLSSFDKASDTYKNYVKNCCEKALLNFRNDIPYVKIWHIQGSHPKIGKPSSLLTFHECSELTPFETNILNSFDQIFVTSTYSQKVFKDNGVEKPVHYIKLGFDNIHYKKIDKKFYTDDSIVFSIFGKAESRKHTKKVIQYWIKKFGGNKKYRLHIHVTNPFFSQEQMNAFYTECFEGKQPPFNTILYGYQATSSLLNECINSSNIVIDMSGAESLSLPSLTAACLGKHIIAHRAPGLSDWIDKCDASIVEPSGMIPVYDNIFFMENSPFNKGSIFTWNDEDFYKACDLAIQKYEKNPINESGFKLQKEYSYENGVNDILTHINNV